MKIAVVIITAAGLAVILAAVYVAWWKWEKVSKTEQNFNHVSTMR